MKVKVLNARLECYWYSNSIGEEFDVIYVIKDRDNTYRQTDKPRYIRNVDAVITELPESFCVKRCDDEEKWKKYIDWLNKTCKNDFGGYGVSLYYGSHKGGGWYAHTSFGTEIHIDDMIKHIDYMNTEFDLTTNEGRLGYARKYYPIGTKYKPLRFDGNVHYNILELNADFKPRIWVSDYSVDRGIEVSAVGLIYHEKTNRWAEIIKEEKNMETQKLSRQGLKEIHSVACSTWKILLEQYGSRNPLEDYIDLTQEEVNQMFDACTPNQLPIVSKYLKKDDLLDFDKISGSIQTPDGQQFIGKRVFGKFENKSFYLHNAYDWEIKEDDLGELCLIPTKKK